MSRTPDISPLSVLLSRVDAVADGSPARETIACGFPSLDKMLGGGFRRGDLTILGGDAGSGKSALALAFALRAAAQGARAAFLSTEMSIERLLERVIAIEARTRIDDLRQGALDEMTRANAGAVALKLRERLPILDLVPPARVKPLPAFIDELPDVDLMIVDSLAGLASGDSGTALDQELAVFVRELKRTALDREVALVATAPLPRLDARDDRRPTLDDFGALGSVKQLADIVLALFREDMYQPARDIEGATELLVRKNRNGPTGYVDLYFYAQWMRFEDMLDPDR
ncbi:MAG TPA: DnaB-like helicase C-terminal domain-containing protein [Gemmatimonadaceae bacterium]|nr:DnaB-like helicase C-terminal domain-containing protein [Gemmatimonadaceae bacterium]